MRKTRPAEGRVFYFAVIPPGCMRSQCARPGHCERPAEGTLPDGIMANSFANDWKLYIFVKIIVFVMRKTLLLALLVLFAADVLIYAKPKNSGSVILTREFYVENGQERSGFGFINEHNYDVRIDAGLYFNGDQAVFDYPLGGLVESETIVLKPNEKYIWRCGDKMLGWDGRVYRCFPEYFYVKCTTSKEE